MRLFTFFAFLFFPFICFGQNLLVKGLLSDEDHKGLAAVSIERQSDKKSTVSDREGKFQIEVKTGDTLLFTYQGKRALSVRIDDDQFLLLTMIDNQEKLEELILKVRRSPMESVDGKLVYHIADLASNTGLSVNDMLKKIPGISIGQNDEILFRGSSSVNMMIDGKMTNLSGPQLLVFLNGLRAEDIEKVEVINSPSVKYDANGINGIINIVSKKKTISDSYAIDLESKISKGKFWMNNQNISASIQQQNWRIYGSFDYNTPHRFRFEQNHNSLMENGNKVQLDKKIDVPFHIYYYTWKVGADWDIKKSQTVGFHYHGSFDDFSGTKLSQVLKYDDKDGTLMERLHSNYELKEPYRYHAYNMDYLFLLDSLGKRLSADARLVNYENGSDAILAGLTYDAHGNLLSNNEMRTMQPGTIQIKSLQADLELPYSSFNINTGVKYAVVSNDNNFIAENNKDGRREEIDELTDHFRYMERVSAGYISAKYVFAKTTLDFGLRFEHTLASSRLEKGGFFKEYNYSKWYPNLVLSKEFNNNHKIDFSISKRINRPSYAKLNPVRWYNDAYFYYFGNPDLLPETAWNFSALYSLKNKYFFDLTYGKRENFISELLSLDENGRSIRLQSANFNQYDRVELSFSSPIEISKYWNTQVSLTGNYSKYPFIEAETNRIIENWAGQVMMSNQVNVLDLFSADISMNYMSSEMMGVFKMGDYFFVDIGIKRSFMNKKLELAFSANDLFNGYAQMGKSISRLIDYQYHEKPDSRRFSFSLKYHIGGNIWKDDKKKSEEQNRL